MILKCLYYRFFFFTIIIFIFIFLAVVFLVFASHTVHLQLKWNFLNDVINCHIQLKHLCTNTDRNISFNLHVDMKTVIELRLLH